MWSTHLLVGLYMYISVFVCVRPQLFSHFSSYGMSMGFGGQGACYNTEIGSKSNDARPYTYYMEPQNSEFNIVIPEYPGCRKVGVAVSVCETGGASTMVQVMSYHTAFVRRTGNISKPGRADIVVYCAH